MDLREIRHGRTGRHPWEVARAACILRLMAEKHFRIIADIGAGDLYFARQLMKRHPARVLAVDKGYEPGAPSDGIDRLKNLSDVTDGSLDFATLMDVLEHEQDDGQLLTEAFRKLKPEGWLLITVPAHPFLFSAHDVFLGHFRRYSRRRLHELLRGLDAEIERSFYFFTALFLWRCMQVLLAKVGADAPGKGVGGWPFADNHPFTKCLAALLKADFALSRRLARSGLHLPGLSICLIAKKKSAS